MLYGSDIFYDWSEWASERKKMIIEKNERKKRIFVEKK
jgi:hypothetical protein